MAKVVELQADGNILRLEIVNELNWCQVYLINDKITSLGADTAEIIKTRLVDYFRGKNTDKKLFYAHKDLELQWILSLSEKHATIYGTLATCSGDMKIFCVEDGGHFLSEMNLRKRDIKEWILTLENLQ